VTVRPRTGQDDPGAGAVQNGFLVIADITGYTAYLRGAELEHAHETLSSLLRLLLQETKAPLTVTRTAGDAVISFAVDGTFTQPQTLVERLEGCYVSFRRALELMILNTTCPCTACATLGTLDLKLFVHHGAFMTQRIGSHLELVGADVNLVHRLTKNGIPAATGLRAYTAYSEAATDALGLHAFFETMPLHSEHYADAGDVRVRLQDMTAVWHRAQEAGPVRVAPGSEVVLVATDLPVDLVTAWEAAVAPGTRATLVGADSITALPGADGRLGPGAVYRCVHGTRAEPHMVVDWQPFAEYTVVAPGPLPGTIGRVTTRVTEAPGGTRLSIALAPTEGPRLLRALANAALRRMAPRMLARAFAKLARQLEDSESDGPARRSPAKR
jgi:hypothetical protein